MANPYAPPKSSLPKPSRDWIGQLVAPFLSSLIAVPAGLVLVGALTRAPDLFARPSIVFSIIAGAAASALVLLAYRKASWLVRAILAPAIGFPVFFGSLVALSGVAA